MHQIAVNTTKERIDLIFQGENKQYIKLNRLGIKDEDIDHIVQRQCTQMKKLQLQLNEITEKGVEKLAKAKIGLTYLSLFRNNINYQGCLHLSNAPWKQLQSLIISYNEIGDIGAKLLTQSNWMHLKSLGINQCNITDVGLNHLSKGQWKQLQQLKLSDNNLGRQCFAMLIKGNWKNLISIDLSWNMIKYEGVLYLYEADWEQLKQSWIRYNEVAQHKHKVKEQAFRKSRMLQMISV